MEWIYLIIAIALETVATLSLKVASGGRTSFYWLVAIGYIGAFSVLSLALSEGLALGVAYGIWAASGVAAAAVLSRIIFKEPLTLLMGGGIGLIIVGVLLVELGAQH
ncbi:MAG TPA: QacE family quaternary ammonium compound efflux SMR transporter [Candidatus Dietzia merdigallinarum]|jgi:small multidrug resistance pump|nr:QacE family quaternary ammonium compound efflux SMR transporter [Candidatus Dietzia merdigallinarum]